VRGVIEQLVQCLVVGIGTCRLVLDEYRLEFE
jgi:hypothetical protein